MVRVYRCGPEQPTNGITTIITADAHDTSETVETHPRSVLKRRRRHVEKMLCGIVTGRRRRTFRGARDDSEPGSR